MKVLGVQQAGKVPALFNTENGSSGNVLFYVSYEKNPLDKLCGDRVIVKAKSVNIVYDAQTIIELVSMFKVQNKETLQQWVSVKLLFFLKIEFLFWK